MGLNVFKRNTQDTTTGSGATPTLRLVPPTNRVLLLDSENGKKRVLMLVGAALVLGLLVLGSIRMIRHHRRASRRASAKALVAAKIVAPTKAVPTRIIPASKSPEMIAYGSAANGQMLGIVQGIPRSGRGRILGAVSGAALGNKGD